MNKVNVGNVLNVVAICLFFESIFFLPCIPLALIFNEPVVGALFKSLAIMVGAALLCFVFAKKKKVEPSTKDVFLSVVVSWVLISVFGAVPYILTNSIPKFYDAFFETVSGFSTTGSSILTDVEILPKSVLFWRAMTHWLGGMGIIVLVIAFLPYFKIGGQQMMMAEGGFFSTDKIKSRTIDVAKRMWFIYFILTLAEIISLMIAGMGWFDSVCHSFATIATGGFSTKNASLIEASPAIQYIVSVFMILAGMNFALHYLFVHRKFKKVFQNEEMKVYLAIILIASVAITVVIHQSNGLGWEKSFRDSLFQVSTLITATGFASADYLQWPLVAKMILLLVMLTGACAGSTGGGVKVARYVVIYKNMVALIRKAINPNSVQVPRYCGAPIAPHVSAGIVSFIFIYYMTIVVGTIVMMLTDLDFVTASSSVITTLGGIGPGFNKVGPVANFSGITEFGKYYLSFNMILGRLEILSVLVLFIPSFYKK